MTEMETRLRGEIAEGRFRLTVSTASVWRPTAVSR